MKFSKTHAMTAGILLFVAAVFTFVLSKSSEPGPYDGFAKCLTDKDVKMYGAYWCPHCANQKREFGSSWKYVDYIECSLPNNAGQTEFCKQAGVKGYPTWEFADKTRVEGEISLQYLGEKSGCALG